MVSGADSGLCEMTNQKRLGIGEAGLKETEAKTKGLRGGIHYGNTGQYEKSDVFF